MMLCTKHAVATVVVFVLACHVVCQGQQLDLRYTSLSSSCRLDNLMPVMTGENVSVGVHLTYTGPPLENEIISMTVHITPTGWFADDVAELCWGGELFRRLEQGDEIEIWCDALVPFDLELGWYYFVVEYEYAPNIYNYPIAGYLQVVRGGGTGACCIYGYCENLTQAECECDRLGTYQGEGTMCLGDHDPANERDDACERLTPQTGACCSDTGCRESLTIDECKDLPGIKAGWMGLGTSCSDVLCPDRWACCHPSQGCYEMWPLDCVNWGGKPQIGLMCSDNPCVVQACCVSDGSCVESMPWDCRGTPQGPGVMCSPGLCGGPECLGDLDGDGIVMISDLGRLVSLLGQAGPPYRIMEGDPLWDPSADMDGNGIIMISDLGQLISILGTAGPPYRVACS